MPKLISPNGFAVLTATTGANYYRIQGVEIKPADGIYAQDLVRVGTATEGSVSQLPHDLDFDRDYIHGDPVAGSKRGIALNGISTTVENCYLSAFTSTYQDTQAIAGWNGPGPFLIKNNYLESGTENVGFGGAVTSIPGVVPSDIIIQNNYFFKSLSWKPGDPSYAGTPIWVKNHFELKNAQRVTIDSNLFENNWVGADQRGFAFQFTVRTEFNQVPWAVINDITVTNNVIRHSGAGINLLGHDESAQGGGSSARLSFRNNVFEDISPTWGSDGRLFQILNGVRNIEIDHNTAFNTGYFAVFDIAPSNVVDFTNNIVNFGAGLISPAGQGNVGLAAYDIGGTFQDNVLIGGSTNSYPANNYFPGSMSQVGFIDFPGGNYALAAGSPYQRAGTDGKDLGAILPGSTPVTISPPSGWNQIISKNSGKCLDVSGISTAPSAILIQWDCWGGDNQRFMFTPVAGGYEITAKHSGLAFDIDFFHDLLDGAALNQYTFWNGPNQIFQINKTPDGYYTINPTVSGKCLDVSGISLANGAPVIQWACWGGDNEKWSFVP